MIKINFSYRTETGLIRKNNEDNFYCKNGIFAVCDGMGGESCGELASLITIKTLDEHADKISSSKNIDEAVQDFVSDSNNKICKIMREKNLRMGTTLALVIISGSIIRVYNIGDSRIYKMQNDILSCISEDHTMAVQKIKMGLITPNEARHDKSRHVLTRCIGIFEDEMLLTPDIISPFKISERTRLLLCSDGLTDMLPDSQIQNIMLENKKASSAVNELVNQALQNGGRDNITCIVINIMPEGE